MFEEVYKIQCRVGYGYFGEYLVKLVDNQIVEIKTIDVEGGNVTGTGPPVSVGDSFEDLMNAFENQDPCVDCLSKPTHPLGKCIMNAYCYYSMTLDKVVEENIIELMS